MDLEQLNKKIIKCKSCQLHKSCFQILAGEGKQDSEIMFIGEAPGSKEDKSGNHFVGSSGKVLDELLDSINLSRDNIYITNIVKCHPPQNRSPYPSEIKACKKWITLQIEIINPKVIVPLGRFAMERFFPFLKVSQSHGEPKVVKGRDCFIMYHPAVALYDSSKKKILMDDFQKLRKFLNSKK